MSINKTNIQTNFKKAPTTPLVWHTMQSNMYEKPNFFPISRSSKTIAKIKKIQNNNIEQLTSSLSQTQNMQNSAYENLIRTSDHQNIRGNNVEKETWSNEHVYILVSIIIGLSCLIIYTFF